MKTNQNTASSDIRRSILAADRECRQKHTWLKHQDAIGFALTMFASVAAISLAAAYFYGALPAFLVVLAIALCCSILHELEHDLIHNLYFRDNKIIQNLLMLLIWAIKPNTISPWYRRTIHLHHHMVSGSDDDLEERLLGNGNAYGIKRVIQMIDPPIGYLYFFKKKINAMSSFNALKILKNSLPFYALYLVVFDICFIWLVALGISELFGWNFRESDLMNGILTLGLLWVLPNMLRGFCLNFVTSTLHYCGDNNVPLRETQVLNHWIFAPFNLFCMNFGGTHAIHHLFVGQPFYIRQMCARRIYGTMRDCGMRFNDFAVFGTANRWV
jgi:fatty acid desaturase